MQQKGNNILGLKRVLIVTLLFMMIGTSIELYLLDHYEDVEQLIPMCCIGASLLVMCLLFFWKTAFLLNLFKLLLALTAISGIYGIFLHLQANYEFEQEIKPSLTGAELFWESLAGALPTLAPGSLIALALIGYAYLLLLQQKQ